MSFHLIYDAAQKEELEESLFPLVEEIISGKAAWEGEMPAIPEGNKKLLLYLSNQQLKTFVSAIAEKEITIAVLPHPEAKQACRGLGVDSDLKSTIEHLKSTDVEIEMDVLYCNGQPVFNNLVIGHAFQLTTSKRSKSKNWFSRTAEMFAKFVRLKPFMVVVAYGEEKSITTAVAGIVVAQHKKSVLLSRLILDDSSVNDGMLHAFLLSPRSIVQLVHFGFRSAWERNPIPGFGAHMKTNKLTFSCPEEGGLEFAEDGETLSAKEIVLEVKQKQIRMIPGELLQYENGGSKGGEIFRLNSLPVGAAAETLAERRLPILRKASTEEFKELFQVLRDNANTKASYLVLMVLSTILATFGLFGNSAPVVIGAMILAPLMAPIISLSMATLRQDKGLALQSGRTILAGLGISFLFAVIITLVTPLNFPNAEILSRTRPNLLDLGIAVVSGIAGAYAHAREEIAKTLAGVAIAVALVPPLAVAGIGLGWADWSIFSGSALLLFTNLAGMVLAGAATFLLLGFSPLKLATRGIIISLVIVLVLSVPLGFGFKQMIDEHQLIQRLDGWETEAVVIKDVRVQRLQPLTISVKVVSAEPLSGPEMNALTSEMEGRLQQPAVFEITAATRR